MGSDSWCINKRQHEAITIFIGEKDVIYNLFGCVKSNITIQRMGSTFIHLGFNPKDQNRTTSIVLIIDD